MSQDCIYHVPALLPESIAGLNIRPDGTYVDATYGGGGHAKAILERLSEKGRLFAFDQDADAERNILPDQRLTFIRGNFRYFSNFMDWYGVEEIDGILADLGVSSHHFDDETRGFSFRFESDLDMRMNKRAGQTAADVLNLYSEEALSDLFYLYGELRNARAIAKAVIRRREEKKIRTTQDFLDILKPYFNREKEKKFLSQAFQAVRVEVNEEMDALKEMLNQAGNYLKTGKRCVIIAYQSTEDRIVKNFFKTGNFQGEQKKDLYGNTLSPFKPVNNKVVVPEDKEIEQNPRSRSAKLRIGEKLYD